MNIKPKSNFIDGTREIINKDNQVQELSIGDVVIKTHPEVFNPVNFFSSQWFAEKVSNLVSGETVLIEVGCGTGIVSILSAKRNKDLRVYATDISKDASNQTRINSQSNGVSDRVAVYSGDVLDSIPEQVKADSIFWAMPFGYLNPEETLSGRDEQVFDPGYRAIKKFFYDSRKYLKNEGRLLIGFSADIGHLGLFEEISKNNGFSLDLLDKTKGVEKEAVSMEIYEARMSN